MIATCKESYGAVENMSFYQVGAEDFSFDKQFDLIVSFYALHYVENHGALLSKIYDALKPGGSLQENRWHSQHESDYRKILYEVGFSDIETRTIDHYRYMTRKELFDWSFSWVPYVTGLDDDMSTKFTNDLVDNICKGQEHKEAVEFSSPILHVNAKKLSEILS